MHTTTLVKAASSALLLTALSLAVGSLQRHGDGASVESRHLDTIPIASGGGSQSRVTATGTLVDRSGRRAVLYPGSSGLRLRLTVGNGNAFAVTVTSLAATVSSPSAACAAANVVVTPFTGRLTVPARGSAAQDLPVAMVASAPDACQSVTLPLTFSGTAVK